MADVQFKEILKAVLDLGFPAAVAVWMLWRDARWMSFLEGHSTAEMKILERMMLLMEDLRHHNHGTPPTNTR